MEKNYITQSKLYQWVESFQSGRTSTDEDHSGSPTTSWMVGGQCWMS